MALDDLFKSKKQREREIRREKHKSERMASRELTSKLAKLKDKIKEIRDKKDKDWAKAKEYMKSGQKAAASRLLKSCRATELLASKLERKAWFWEQKGTNVEVGGVDKGIAEALRSLAEINQSDPEEMEEVLVDIEDVLGEQADIDRMVDSEYQKEMEGLAEEEAVDVASLEEMEKELADEVAAEIEDQSIAEPGEAETVDGERIGTLRERLKDLLEDEE